MSFKLESTDLFFFHLIICVCATEHAEVTGQLAGTELERLSGKPLPTEPPFRMFNFKHKKIII